MLVVPVSFSASTTMSLINISPQIASSDAEDDFGIEYTLYVSSFPEVQLANMEMAPAPEGVAFSHSSFFILDSFTFVEPIPFQFVIDTPQWEDQNGNGIIDFFDVDSALNGEAVTGFHDDGFGGSSEFTMSWFRDAGSYSGLCIISLPEFGLVFETTFSLIRYQGSYTYSRSGQILDGAIALQLEDNETDVINGPLDLTILDNDTLTWANGTWSGPNDFTYIYEPEDNFDRLGGSYVSVVWTEDGSWGTPQQDYQLWFAVLPATDSDSDGTPDLVEGGGVTPGRPSLAPRRVPQGMEITVTGTLGAVYTLQTADIVEAAAAQWTTLQTITMSSTAQTVVVPTSGMKRFFRLRF